MHAVVRARAAAAAVALSASVLAAGARPAGADPAWAGTSAAAAPIPILVHNLIPTPLRVPARPAAPLDLSAPEPAAAPPPDPPPSPDPPPTAAPATDQPPAVTAGPDRGDQAGDAVHPVASALILGGMYTTFTSWAYLAWYFKHKPLSSFRWGGDGWFGARTYAGGADKFGHAWSTMSLTRAGTLILASYGGHDRLTSSLVSAGLAETLFTLFEVKDGFYYEFSFSDFTADTTGAALAVLLDNVPRLDEMFDYRVEYAPSTEYWNNVSDGNGFNRLNIAEDYSGETYLLAYHLGSIPALRAQRWGTLSRFVDLTVGFRSRGYKPSPPAGYPPYEHHQDLFVGVSLNAQGLFDWLLEGRRSHAARTTRKITHGLFEIFNLPYTSHYLLDVRRRPNGQVAMDGA